MSAPAPCGPPSLCDEIDIRSAPSARCCKSNAARGLHCIDVRERRTPHARCRQLPDWLDGARFVIREHHGDQRPPGLRQGAPQARRDRQPHRLLQAILQPDPAANRPPHRTDGCSIAETNSRSRCSLRPPISIVGVSASMLASVAPLVNVTFLASAPTDPATRLRASSTRRRAARPSACTDDALPVRPRAPLAANLRLVAQRGGRIPVKIGPFSHGLRAIPNYRFTSRPRKKLAFCPGDRGRSPKSTRPL